MWHIIIQFAVSIRIKTEITNSLSLARCCWWIFSPSATQYRFWFFAHSFPFFFLSLRRICCTCGLLFDCRWKMANEIKLQWWKISAGRVFVWMGWYTQTADVCLCVCVFKRLDLPMPFDKLREVVRHKAMQRINKNKTDRCVWTGYIYIEICELSCWDDDHIFYFYFRQPVLSVVIPLQTDTQSLFKTQLVTRTI